MNQYYFNYLERLVVGGRLIACCRLTDRHGKTICEKNEALNPSVWAELSKLHHASRVMSSIGIVGEYTCTSLEADFISVLMSDKYLGEFFDPESHLDLLRQNLHSVCVFPALRQHLTLLNLFLPQAFERAVFCAFFATLVYLDIDANESDIRNIFIAALCHDIGLLYIDPFLIQDPNGSQHKDYFTHVEIAANLLSKLVGVARTSVRAVMEHHEHLDGSGDPKGLGSNQLSYAGQYIHLLDNLYLLYVQHFQAKGKSLCDTIPIVEMNSISHFGHAAKATIKVLQRGTRTEGTLIPAAMLKPLISKIKKRFHYILLANEIIQNFTHAVGFRHDDKALFMLQNSMIHVALTLDKSQLLNPAYMRWLDHVIEFDVKREHHLIEVSFLMTNEVMYHIEKFRNQLSLYRQFCNQKNILPHVELALKRFQSEPLPTLNNPQHLV